METVLNSIQQTDMIPRVQSLSDGLPINEKFISFPPLHISWTRIVEYFGACYDEAYKKAISARIPDYTEKAEKLKCAALFDCIINSAKGIKRFKPCFINAFLLTMSKSGLAPDAASANSSWDKREKFHKAVINACNIAWEARKASQASVTYNKKMRLSVMPNSVIIVDICYPWSNSFILKSYFMQGLKEDNDRQSFVINALFRDPLLNEKSLYEISKLAANDIYQKVSEG